MREGATNVLRHARAAELLIRPVHTDDGRHGLELDNDGADSSTTIGGTGLAGLADRARTLGGTVTHRNEAGRFRLRVLVPRAAPDPDEPVPDEHQEPHA